MEFIDTYINLYGPLAVFLLLMLSGIGIPLGEDIIIIPAGLFIGQGKLAFWPTLAAAYVGVVGADVLWFYICGRYGTRLLHKRWFRRLVHPRRLLEVKHQFDKRGMWIVIMARFIPSSRTTTITIAGMLHMPLWKFAAATAACVVITAPLQLGLGILVAKGIGDETETPRLVMWSLGLVAIIIATSMGLSWYLAWRRSAKRRAPRGRVAWLRKFRPPRRKRSLSEPSGE